MIIFNGGMKSYECVTIASLANTSNMNGTLLLLAMTFDKFLAIKVPLKAPVYCTPSRTKRTCGAVCIFSIVWNLPHWVLTKLVNNGKTCASLQTRSQFGKIYSWASLVLNAFIPFILLVMMNGSIIMAIRNRGKQLKLVSEASQTQHNGQPNNTNKNKLNIGNKSVTKVRDKAKDKQSKMNKAAERQLTIMLLLVSFAFVILGLAYHGRIMAYTFIQYHNNAHKYATFVLIYHITNKCLCLNSSINLFLYCLGGSKFRNDLVKLFFHRKDKNSNDSSLIST